jgi:hypothetical protein
MSAPVAAMTPMPAASEVTAAAPVASPAKMMTAAETAMSAEMVSTSAMAEVVAAAVMASVSRFGDDRHGQCRHHRHHENDYAFHCGSLGFGQGNWFVARLHERHLLNGVQ